MSKSSVFFESLPALHGIEADLALIFGGLNVKLLQFEANRPDSSLSRENIPDSKKRMAPAFGAWKALVPADKLPQLDYCERLAVYMDMVRGIDKGTVTAVAIINQAEELRGTLVGDEAKFPEVSALLTVEEAEAEAVAAQWG